MFLGFSNIELVSAQAALRCEFKTLFALACTLFMTQIQVANKKKITCLFFILGKCLVL